MKNKNFFSTYQKTPRLIKRDSIYHQIKKKSKQIGQKLSEFLRHPFNTAWCPPTLKRSFRIDEDSQICHLR